MMFTGLALVLTIFVGPAPVANLDEATTLAIKLTTEGAANFDRKDAKALAESFTEDATLRLIAKPKDSDRPSSEVRRGRGDIQAEYERLFKDAGTIHSKNTIEYARLTNPSILLIAGVFEPGLGEERFKVGFVQVRFRQNEKWLISSMQIFLFDGK